MHFTLSIGYLRTEAKGAIYVTLMKKIKIAAYRNNVTIPEGFGLKEKKVRPTIVEMMESSGNFTVRTFTQFY